MVGGSGGEILEGFLEEEDKVVCVGGMAGAGALLALCWAGEGAPFCTRGIGAWGVNGLHAVSRWSVTGLD